MTYCLSNEKVCHLGHYYGCLFINQWNSEKCGTIVRIQRLTPNNNNMLTSKRNASFTFDAPYFLNNRLILLTEVTILHSDIISNQKCKLVTFHADTRKVIGRSKLLHPYAMPALVMDYLTKHRCIHSTLRPHRQINRRWCEIVVRSLQ